MLRFFLAVLGPYRCTTYPRRIVIVYAGYILSLLFLFAQFYINSYSKKPSAKKTA